MTEIFTVGHSSVSIDRFIALLQSAEISAVADVRSSPSSRMFPQFNAELLKQSLSEVSVAYSFLGKELGGRPRRRDLFTDGVADYEKMADSKEFRTGLNRIQAGSKKYRIAAMCSERDPLDCHRCLLVGRELSNCGFTVKHILHDGECLDQSGVEEKLLLLSGKEHEDMFSSPPERIRDAYRERARKIAFSLTRIPTRQEV